MKEAVQDRGQSGIAKKFVGHRHGARLNVTREAISHHELGTRAPLLNKLWNLGEVITVVRITHDDELAPSFIDSLSERIPVSPDSGMNHPGSALTRDFDGTVRCSVIGDNYFPANSVLAKSRKGLVYAQSD